MRPITPVRGAAFSGSRGSAMSTLLEEAQRAERAGHRELARRHYESVLYLLRPDGPATDASMILRRVGRLYLDDGDIAAGLDCVAAALAVAGAHGDAAAVANATNLIAISHWQRGQLDEAEDLYRDAGHMAQGAGAAQLVCERVLQQARPVNDVRVLAEIYKHCGVIDRELGRPEEADEFLRMALDTALGREDFLLAAETAREQAELYTTLRRNREALQALNMSHRLFSRVRVQRDLADVRRRINLLERRFLDVVRQWGQSIESKDRYTLGHCERVADYACAVARDMGFDEQTLFWMRVGALLHDVGKIVVPSDILNKAAPLTPAERAIIERHAAAGADLLKDVEFSWDVLPMVRHHHERWDGAGYPDRLSADGSPVSARMLCVGDVDGAATPHRPDRV